MDNILDKKYLSVDTETLGTGSKAPLIQIGAVLFSAREGLINSFEQTIDFDDAVKYGEADGGTIKWWLKQSEDARESVTTDDAVPLSTGIANFNRYLEQTTPNGYWAHATFDYPILANACKAVDHPNKLHYQKCLDLRTLEVLAPQIAWPSRSGVHHSALDDAKHQAECIIMLLEALYND